MKLVETKPMREWDGLDTIRPASKTIVSIVLEALKGKPNESFGTFELSKGEWIGIAGHIARQGDKAKLKAKLLSAKGSGAKKSYTVAIAKVGK